MAFLRAREVEQEIKNRGQEAGTVWCIQVLAEQQIALQKDMRTMAQHLDQMANIIAQFTTVAENMKNTVEKLNNQSLYEDDLPKNTERQ